MNARKEPALMAKRCFGHLGGKTGDRIFARFIESGWLEPVEGTDTAYRITKKGSVGLERLGVNLREDKE
jgi:hypothetical protein